MGDEEKDEDEEFTSEVGPLKVDWPRAIGYYGAVGAAVAFEVIAPPLGLFIALVPLLKLLRRRNASKVERVVAAVIEGAGKPVGGDAEGVVRSAWVDEENEENAKTGSAGARTNGVTRAAEPSRAMDLPPPPPERP